MLRINCNNGGNGFKIVRCLCISKVFLGCSRRTRIPQTIYHLFLDHHWEFQKYCWALLMLHWQLQKYCQIWKLCWQLQKYNGIGMLSSRLLQQYCQIQKLLSQPLQIYYQILCGVVLNCWKYLYLIHGEKRMVSNN